MDRIEAALLLTLCAIEGCASTGDASEKCPGPPEYPVLIGRFAEEPVEQPLVAREAFFGDDEFFVSYESAEGLVYAGGNWSHHIDLCALKEGTDDTYTGPYILPLEYQQRERWEKTPQEPIRPRLLSIEQWNRFRDDFLRSVLPADPRGGIALHFDADDYFLYHNELGEFEARLLVDKPGDYRVAASIDFATFIRAGLPQLERFLSEEGVTERRVVFSTGDAGAYSLPFLYVNLDLPIAVFTRRARRPRLAARGSSEAQVAQSVGHLVDSHLTGMAIRPVSSVSRLFFVATNAAVETVRPTWMVTLEARPIPELDRGPGMDLSEWERQLDGITAHEPSRGTIDYLIDGEEYFTRFVDAVSSARDSVYLRTYIFDNDDFAETVGRLLRRRSNEGVDVKVLLDGLGTILATTVEDESLPDDYVPPESVRVFLEEGSEIDVRQTRNPWLAGDHVKTTIVDGEIAFTGGMNIGREYRYGWHDLMMEVHGPLVDILRREFLKAWTHAGPFGDVGYVFRRLAPNRHLSGDEGYPIRVLYTRTGNAEIFRAQQAAIRNARSYAYVENAYFTDDAMLYELAQARCRGVDVRVILPLVGNHGPIRQSNVLAANAMLAHGIRVYLYPGMSHVKAAVIDGWACLGSANWDKLSFRVNKELDLATSHPQAVDELLERLFEADFARSVELTEPFPERWSDHLVEIVADYLL